MRSISDTDAMRVSAQSLVAFALLFMPLTIPLQVLMSIVSGSSLFGVVGDTIRIVALFAAFLAFVRIRSLGRRMRKRNLIAACCAAIMCGTYLANLARTPNGLAVQSAVSEVVRLAYWAMLLFAVSNVGLGERWLKRVLGIQAWMGFLAGVATVLSAYLSTTSLIGNQIGDLTRAGTGYVDPNVLGGYLTVSAICALALSFAGSREARRVYFMLFVASSAARFWTFSNGSLLGEICGVAALLVLTGALRPTRLRKEVVLLGVGALAGAAVLLGVHGASLLLDRIPGLSDKLAYGASVTSRVAQYVGVERMISTAPAKLITGVGAVSVVPDLGTGYTLHNALLRPLLVGGVLAFLSYLLANAVAIRSVLHARRGVMRGTPRMLLCGLLAAYVGWTVQSLTLPADSYTIEWYLLALMLAVASATTAESAREHVVGSASLVRDTL